jgi:hypothetical protein
MIEWASGLTKTFTNIDVNQFNSYTEPGGLNSLNEKSHFSIKPTDSWQSGNPYEKFMGRWAIPNELLLKNDFS